MKVGGKNKTKFPSSSFSSLFTCGLPWSCPLAGRSQWFEPNMTLARGHGLDVFYRFWSFRRIVSSIRYAIFSSEWVFTGIAVINWQYWFSPVRSIDFEFLWNVCLSKIRETAILIYPTSLLRFGMWAKNSHLCGNTQHNFNLSVCHRMPLHANYFCRIFWKVGKIKSNFQVQKVWRNNISAGK